MASQRTAANAEVTTGLIVKAGMSTRCANEAQDTIRAETASKANAAKVGIRCVTEGPDAIVPSAKATARAPVRSKKIMPCCSYFCQLLSAQHTYSSLTICMAQLTAR